MERLTERFDDGTVGIANILDKTELIEVSREGEFIAIEASIQEAVNRLARYEDIGLTPEEIKSLHNKYGLLLSMYDKLQKERDYWECEAKKWAAKIGEIRIKTIEKLCNRLK